MNAPETPEEERMHNLASDLVKVASSLAPGYGMDAIEVASALSFASTRILFAYASLVGEPEKVLSCVEIINRTSLKAAADMLAGQETPHQVTQ